MKQLRLFLVATVLMLGFTGSAFAGDMDTTITSPPAATAAGDMETGIIATDSLNEVVLGFMQSMLSLF